MVVISLIIAMVLILLLVSKKLNIGLSLIIGAIVLSLLNGRSALYVLDICRITLTDPTTISLALSISFITILGYMMEKFQLMDRMILSLETLLRSAKATILLAPAIIGTLLVTGGALMSCPMVGNLGERLQLSGDKMAANNLIFRHALYFIFPLSPTLILAVELGGFELWDFIRLQLPIALAMYVFGYFFYLRDLAEPTIDKRNGKDYWRSMLAFILYASPIIVSLLGVVLLGVPFPLSLVAGIILSLILHYIDLLRDAKYKTDESLIETFKNGFRLSMVIAIIGIMIFKNVVNDLDELYAILGNLIDSGVPIELLIVISAFLISFPLASTQPGIAILYPLILPLAPNYEISLLYGMFIYTSCFLAYFISPLHMCQVLTLEYFNVKLNDLYRNYLFVLPLTFIVMVLIYSLNML